MMTETPVAENTANETINEALAIIDRSLADLLNRELVSSDEVADLLLDVRTLLTREDESTPN
jgi:hypothetical protein